MTQARYEAWLVDTIREYAAEKVAAGNYPEEGSLEQSKGEFDTLLPQGLQTPGQEIRSMIDDDGVAAHRRKGHAQAALLEVEAYAREHDCIGVMLHVFGSNAGARQLYQKAGYEETNVIMLKRI